MAFRRFRGSDRKGADTEHMDETDYRSGWDGATARHLAVTQALFGARRVQSSPHPRKRGGGAWCAVGARLAGHSAFTRD